ncbi:MAG: transposase family protein [Pseudonocardiaceae bacterium]
MGAWPLWARSRSTAPATLAPSPPGLTAALADMPAAADLGYVGVEGIEIVPFKRLPGRELNTSQAEFNTALSKIRAAVEHAIAHLKT